MALATPSQLMYGRRITTMPNDNHFDVLSNYASLTKKRKHHYRLRENFTKQWRREYSTGLRETHSRHRREASKDEAVVGDIVILKDDTTNKASLLETSSDRRIIDGERWPSSSSSSKSNK